VDDHDFWLPESRRVLALGQLISSAAKFFPHGNESELGLGRKQRNQIDHGRGTVHKVCDRVDDNVSELLEERILGDATTHFGVEQDGSRKVPCDQAIRSSKIDRRDYASCFGSKAQKAEVF